MKWYFSTVWNESLETRVERELKPRERIWASEITGSLIDRYLKMTAVKPTNPPNPRSLRKFEAGNMMEWIVGVVLKRAGILISNQDWLQFQYPGLYPVTGKLDFFAGGNPDWDKAKNEVKVLELPQFFSKATDAIIAHFADKYPNGLEKIVLEIKSCSNFMMERYEKKGVNLGHALQSFHYLKAKNMNEAHVVYICKDDLRMLEFPVNNPSEELLVNYEDIYKSDIMAITHYHKNKIMPEKEKEIFFDEVMGKFSANWKVGYSNYLTMLYGYENQKAYDDKFKPIVSRFNRVLKRCVNSDKMTDKNKVVLDEIRTFFPNFDDILTTALKDPAALAGEPDEEAT